MKSLVYIILLNWNGWRDTVECVESCRRLTHPNFRIIIVDNGSSDGSEAILRERCPDAEFIQTGANLGFAGGNNRGIRHALEREADYVWLLNNDTTVDSNALNALVDAAESNERIGMLGSKILYHDDPTIIWYAGAVLSADRPYITKHIGLMEKDMGQYDKSCETGYITGCSLFVGRCLVEDIGMLAEELFLYFEDVDWCSRAQARGWKLIYCPQSLVYHKVSMSVGGSCSPLMYYYSARNLLYFVKRSFPKKLYGALAYDLYEFVLVNIKKGRVSAALGAIKGIGDYFMARMGRLS